jgi:hypothetical protein
MAHNIDLQASILAFFLCVFLSNLSSRIASRGRLVALRENNQFTISFIPITTNFPPYFLSLARGVFPDAGPTWCSSSCETGSSATFPFPLSLWGHGGARRDASETPLRSVTRQSLLPARGCDLLVP